MSNELSDSVVKDWRESGGQFSRASFTVRREFDVKPGKIFPLLCPTLEYDWLPGWTCEMLHSETGYAEHDCIFKTEFFGFPELWICTKYLKDSEICYQRISEHLSSMLDIRLIDQLDGSCIGVWHIAISALDEEGNRMIENLEGAEKKFEKAIDALEYFLKEGRLASV